jgi:multidrug efflux pump subunit AcrB
MQPDVRIGDWTGDVDAVLESFQQSLPANIELSIIFDQQRYTNDRLGGLLRNVLMGFVVILTVLFVTLGWRAALVVALTLPLTVGFTLTSMRFFGMPIHQMSVTGLVVALGIMVDNAIVMTDTIQRMMREGASRLEAVQSAIRHLWVPLAGSTLTTILAFMPIALMPGPAGEFVGGIAISVIFALIGSYLVSHTLIAGIAGRFLQARDTHTGIRLSALATRFRRLLDFSLQKPKTSIAVALILPVLGFMAATQMAEQFFPPSDRDMFNVEVYLEPAASLSATREFVDRLSPEIESADGIERVQWFLGGSAPPFYYNLVQSNDQTPNFAQAMVTARDFESANRAIPVLQERLDKQFPEAQILVRKLEQGPPFAAPVEIRIFGPNLDTLSNLGESIKRIALMTEDVIHVRSSQEGGRPKARLVVDENRVRRAGLAPVELAAQLQAVLDGVEGGSIMESTEELPVRLRLGEANGDSPEDLNRLHLAAVGEQPVVSLTSLGDVAYEPAAGAITRRQGQRINTVEVFLRADILPAIVQERMEQALASSDIQVPPAYRLEFGGEGAERDNAVGNLMANIGLIIILLVITVVLSFDSFRLSLIVFAVAGLSTGPGLLCVWAFGYPFGFQVIVGLMGLMGLAINAAIVIMAELKSDPRAILGDPAAIREGVMNCTRHIGSTTLTTLGGFTPLILAGGGFWPPFALAIAGGTVLTSVLSFLLVPAAFRLFALRKPFEVTGQPVAGRDQVKMNDARPVGGLATPG